MTHECLICEDHIAEGESFFLVRDGAMGNDLKPVHETCEQAHQQLYRLGGNPADLRKFMGDVVVHAARAGWEVINWGSRGILDIFVENGWAS